MSEKEIILTEEGLKKLEEQLEELITVRRKKVAERIKQAIDFGDLSENSEYEDAKNEQAFIEGEIQSLERKLRNAKVIDGKDIDLHVVSVGTNVRMEALDTNEILEYAIVGTEEADPTKSRISNESPVGKGLLNHKVDEIVEIEAPIGTIKYKILAIGK